MFSRRIGVGAGRGRDFDMHFLTELFQKPPPTTCIVKIHQKFHAFTVVNLFYFCILFAAFYVSSHSPGVTLFLHPWFDAINDVINVL